MPESSHLQSVLKNKTQGTLRARDEVEKINTRIEYFYNNEVSDSICSLFSKEFTYLPEYKPIITNVDDLRTFFGDWFKAVTIKAYKKNIYEVQVISGYILETGTFNLQYSTALNANAEYLGKYMVMWVRNRTGKLSILSEIFGSDKGINPEAMPYATVKVKANTSLDRNTVVKKVQPEIEEYDKGVVKAVLDGDGNARANGFTTDGIYMPHFDKMQIGMDVIKPYMLNTYKPGVFTYVIDTYHEVFDTGDFVFLNCAFNVGSDRSGQTGGFTGNMSNLMKRGKDGKLLMYRQLAHNN